MKDLRSPVVQKAVGTIERRAERESDFRKLYDIYVDKGILSELTPGENQLIIGRRGVGKTHLLYYYRDYLLGHGEGVQYQVHDCSRLGSGLSVTSEAPRTVALNMFTELLNDIGTRSFDQLEAIEDDTARDHAAHAIMAFQDTVGQSVSNRNGPDLRNIADTIEGYRTACGSDYLILALDEWVGIPLPIQPYLAEYLKRAFFRKPGIAVKIATVTYQTKLATGTDTGVIGLESGADLFGDVNLDHYFVWEEDKEGVQAFFAEALYNHLAGELGWSLGAESAGKAAKVVRTFFTQENAFVEVCRAAEGNCRDFLNVFRLSYSQFVRDPGANRIGVPHVSRAAEGWYRQDKLRNITGEKGYEDFLNYLIQEIIRGRKSKTFMVSYRDIDHPLLSRLFTARLLHPLRTTWSHPDRPGEPYHLVTMDYGCYRALLGTRSAPSQMVLFPGLPEQFPEHEDLVPLDDRRSIRRIVLERGVLDRFSG